MVLYGWHSNRAVRLFGSFICLDENGKEVEITYYTSDPEGKLYLWEDKVSLGKIATDKGLCKYVRSATNGEIHQNHYIRFFEEKGNKNE